MERKLVVGMMVILLLTSLCTLALSINPVKAELGRLETVWVSDFLGGVSGVETCDVDIDGIMEIVASDGYNGFIHIFNGVTHEEEWKSDPFDSILSLAVGDVDSDRNTEIVFGSVWRYLYVMDAATHGIEWQSSELVTAISSIRISDVDQDGTTEIVAGSYDNGIGNDAYIYVFDGVNHVLEWTSPDLHWEIQLDVDDVDGDETKEIVCATSSGYVHVFNGVSHAEEWRSSSLEGCLHGLAIGDADGDGTKEIVVGGGAGHIYVFDGFTHVLEWVSDNQGGWIGWIQGLSIHDIDHDGTREIMAGLMTGEGMPAYGVGYIYVYDGITYELETLSDPVDQWIGMSGISISDADGDRQEELITGGSGHVCILRLPKPPSPVESLEELIQTIKSWILPYGTQNSLTSKLQDTTHLLDIGNENGAIHKLMDFISQVEALRGKKLSDVQADYLVSEAQRIIDLIEE